MCENNMYTPEKISVGTDLFSIPLYQRLFEWDRKQIDKLLTDLKLHFDLNNDVPYYIGMLTAHRKGGSGHFDLVDGQQRFTVMMLLAIAFKWDGFSLYENKLRLDFFARPNDKSYLRAKINGETPAKIHPKMNLGLEYISEFIQMNFDTDEQRTIFKDKIYRNLTFFISELPSNYNIEDLNRYFEMMNSAGKNLEKHEILKVELLKISNPKDQKRHTNIWNLVEQMNKPIIPKCDEVARDKYRCNFEAEIKCSGNNLVLQDRISNSAANVTINSILESSNRPSNSNVNEAEGKRALLNFSEFLILVLDITLGKGGKYEFYRTERLLENFEELKDRDVVAKFYDNLLKYRLLFDYYVIKIESDSKGNKYDFEYRMSGDDSGLKDYVKQYQSMLYVSTPYYNWLRDVLVWLEGCEEINYSSMLQRLKNNDNAQRNISVLESGDNMCYGKIERYWFWRLDYYLWEKEVSKEDTADIHIKNYIFRTNRSIEHLHPQNQDNNTEWNDKEINNFGNLAMISTSFNSTQSNDNVNIKFVRIKEQIEAKSLESIKMYEMYNLAKKNEENWNAELMSEHQTDMIQILKKSFELIL